MIDLYEECRNHLVELLDSQQNQDRNEATTRLQIIDHLLFDCLAWSDSDVIAEESHAGEYADYVLHAPRRMVIVEAKKEGLYFEIPFGKEQIEYSLKVLTRDVPELRKALEQVAGYCQTRGVPIGIVCNGHQLVAFIATRNDGIPPLEGRALVFSSLQAMLTHFPEFWRNLSKLGIQEKQLLKRLIGDTSPEVPQKLSASIPDYPGVKRRNIVQADLQIVSEIVFEDIRNVEDGIETKFLEECYCESGALSQYAVISKAILESRYYALFSAESPGPATVPAVDRQGISAELFAESLSRRPILLLGDVGVGKTSFIRHLIRVAAVEIFKNAISLYLDLGTHATLTDNMKEFILQEIADQLEQNYGVDIEERNFVRGVYNRELQNFQKSYVGDLKDVDPTAFLLKEIEFLGEKVKNREQHLRKCLEHITRGRQQQVIIFLDNVDQRHDRVQQEIFLISQEMAERWPATVFVTLRPATFHRSHKEGALSGYHPKAFTISPPRVDRVLEKRLEFARKLATGEIPVQGLDFGIRVRLENLEAILNVFIGSIRRNTDLIEFIDNTCAGNIRIALELVEDFFSSGHVNTQKILDIYQETGSYTIPLHEFVRAVIYGSNEHYDPSRTVIANLLDVSFKDSREHFLLPLLLSALTNAANTGENEGFLETSKLYEKIQGIGFTPEQIDTALFRAYRHGLVETIGRQVLADDRPIPPSLRVTTTGAYHIQKLLPMFAYIDAITVDTPIFDTDTRKVIDAVDSIQDRLDRAEVFIEYLEQQWQPFDSTEISFDWMKTSAALKREVVDVRSRLNRGYE